MLQLQQALKLTAGVDLGELEARRQMPPHPPLFSLDDYAFSKLH